jgi:predicted ATP-dependent endonuclease of OLD family
MRLVQTQNNERIFFADRVILVEGYSDKLLFEAVANSQRLLHDLHRVVEFVEVHGKANFRFYEAILGSFDVPYSIIADLDYARDIDGEEVRALFVADMKGASEALRDKKSQDARGLVEALEEAARTDEWRAVGEIWKYMRARHVRLADLSAAQRAVLDRFVETSKRKQVFLLSRGELETYLPERYRSMEGVLTLTSEEAWLDRLDPVSRCKLVDVVRGACGAPRPAGSI